MNHLCLLEDTHQCCVCADGRPAAPRYSEHINGVGAAPTAVRWRNYCSVCRASHARAPPPLSQEGTAQPNASGLGWQDINFPGPAYPPSTKPPPHISVPTTAPVFLAPPHASHRFLHSDDQFPPPRRPKPYRRALLSPCSLTSPAVVAATSAPQAKAKACGSDHFCALESIPQCCACTDSRPVRTRYPEYVDGIGEVPTAFRWKDYCFACRAAHANVATALSGKGKVVSAPKREDISFANIPRPRTALPASSARQITLASSRPSVPFASSSPTARVPSSLLTTNTDVEDCKYELSLETGTSEWEWNAFTDVDELDSFRSSGESAAKDVDSADQADAPYSDPDSEELVTRGSQSLVSESGMSDWTSVSGDGRDEWSVLSDDGRV